MAGRRHRRTERKKNMCGRKKRAERARKNSGGRQGSLEQSGIPQVPGHAIRNLESK